MPADVGEARRIDLGTKMRRLRSQRMLTMETVAKRVGCSRAFLSRVERNESLPSVSMLVRIAQALNVTVGFFFEPVERERAMVMRRVDRLRTEQNGVVIEHLCRETATHRMHMVLYSLAPGAAFQARRQRHVDESCGVCIRGPVSLIAQEVSLELDAEDAFYLDALFPYRLVNSGLEEAKVLVVASKRPI